MVEAPMDNSFLITTKVPDLSITFSHAPENRDKFFEKKVSFLGIEQRSWLTMMKCNSRNVFEVGEAAKANCFEVLRGKPRPVKGYLYSRDIHYKYLCKALVHKRVPFAPQFQNIHDGRQVPTFWPKFGLPFC